MSIKTVIINSMRVGYNLYHFIIHNYAIYVLYDITVLVFRFINTIIHKTLRIILYFSKKYIFISTTSKFKKTF